MKIKSQRIKEIFRPANCLLGVVDIIWFGNLLVYLYLILGKSIGYQVVFKHPEDTFSLILLIWILTTTFLFIVALGRPRLNGGRLTIPGKQVVISLVLPILVFGISKLPVVFMYIIDKLIWCLEV